MQTKEYSRPISTTDRESDVENRPGVSRFRGVVGGERELALELAEDALAIDEPSHMLPGSDIVAFVRFVDSIIDVSGGMQNGPTRTAEIEDQQQSGSKIVLQTGPTEFDPYAKASLTVVNGRETQIYTYGRHQVGEMLNGTQVELHEHQTGELPNRGTIYSAGQTHPRGLKEVMHRVLATAKATS